MDDAVKLPDWARPRRVKTTEDLTILHTSMTRAGVDILKVKNLSYSDLGEGDPFANFRRHGAFGIVVRMDDKLSRLNTLVKKREMGAGDESILDTAIDLQNYASILIGYLMDEAARRRNE